MCYNWINRKREYLFYVIFQSPNQNLTWRKASSHGNYNTFTTIFVAYNWLKILYSQALSQRPHHFSSDIIFYLNLQFSLRLRSLSLRYMFNGFIYESAATLSLVLVGWFKQLFQSSQHYFKIFSCFVTNCPFVGCFAVMTCFSHHFLPILLSTTVSVLFSANRSLFLPSKHLVIKENVGWFSFINLISQHLFSTYNFCPPGGFPPAMKPRP